MARIFFSLGSISNGLRAGFSAAPGPFIYWGLWRSPQNCVWAIPSVSLAGTGLRGPALP
jgi:hypothetical protein